MDRHPILTVALVLATVAIGMASFYVSITHVPPRCDSAAMDCDHD